MHSRKKEQKKKHLKTDESPDPVPNDRNKNAIPLGLSTNDYWIESTLDVMRHVVDVSLPFGRKLKAYCTQQRTSWLVWLFEKAWKAENGRDIFHINTLTKSETDRISSRLHTRKLHLLYNEYVEGYCPTRKNQMFICVSHMNSYCHSLCYWVNAQMNKSRKIWMNNPTVHWYDQTNKNHALTFESTNIH